MKSGRFFPVRTTTSFSARHRPCERECAAEHGEYETQSYRLVTYVHASSSGTAQSTIYPGRPMRPPRELKGESSESSLRSVQDDWDTPYVMRFCDIFSLANDSKETGVAAEQTWSVNILFHLSGSITWKRSPSSARSR